jgi:hypothetical protein
MYFSDGLRQYQSLQGLKQAYLVDAHVQLRVTTCIQQQDHPVSVRHFSHEYGFKPYERTTI